MPTEGSLEKGLESQGSIEKPVLIVSQPEKIEGLLSSLEVIDSFSERVGEDKSQGIGPSGGTAAATQGDDQSQASARDQAIANLPAPAVMQKEITKHIKEEVKTLRKEVKKVEKMNKPGSAHQLNKLYTRIRRLNGLLSEILESSYDVLKRIFIKVFVDKQPIS